MILPVPNQPNIQAIKAELAVFKRWQQAYLQKEQPLPDLPTSDDKRSTVILLCCLAVYSGLVLLGWIVKFTHLRPLLVWTARQRVAYDRMAFEPASCSLNHAFTELGLALLATGDYRSAIECLRKSWQVRPCPHNTSFGLNPRLWKPWGTYPRVQRQDVSMRRWQNNFL